jgi:hypothetical protein
MELELDAPLVIRPDKRWIWIALCRKTRQVVAYVIAISHKPLVKNSGNVFRQLTAQVTALRTFGQPINRCYRQSNIRRQAKRLA